MKYVFTVVVVVIVMLSLESTHREGSYVCVETHAKDLCYLPGDFSPRYEVRKDGSVEVYR